MYVARSSLVISLISALLVALSLFGSFYFSMDFITIAAFFFPLAMYCLYKAFNVVTEIEHQSGVFIVKKGIQKKRMVIPIADIRGYGLSSIHETIETSTKVTFYLNNGKSLEHVPQYPFELVLRLPNITKEHLKKKRTFFWVISSIILLILIGYLVAMVYLVRWVFESRSFSAKDYTSITATLRASPSIEKENGRGNALYLPVNEWPDLDWCVRRGYDSTYIDRLLAMKANDTLILFIPRYLYEVKVIRTREGSFGEKYYLKDDLEVCGVQHGNNYYLDPNTFELEYFPNRANLYLFILLTMGLILLAFVYLSYRYNLAYPDKK